MHFLNYDSKFMRGLSVVTAGVWVSCLLFLTCLPIFTIGASLTAAHDVCRQILSSRGEGMTKTYFRSFGRNFGKATLLWLVFLPTGVVLLWAWLRIFDTLVLIPKIGFSLLWLMCIEWVFYLQSRFENTVKRTLRNALVFSVVHIGATLALIGIDVSYVTLIWLSILYFRQGLFLLVILGYGNLILIHVPILEHVMRSQIANPHNRRHGSKVHKPLGTADHQKAPIHRGRSDHSW